MANVHSVGDYNSISDNAAVSTSRERAPNIFMMSGENGESVGDSSMYPAVNKLLAPDFTACSFIFVITVLQIGLFFVELLVGSSHDGAFVKDNDMAGPSTATLRIMGGKYLPCIQNGELYRFFTPALLHSGILHIFTNLVSQTMIGYTCEKHWGTCRMLTFYFATAFGATLLSCVGSPRSVSVGASGALLGIIGAYMSWLLLNWNNRQLLPQPCPRMCTMLTWLGIILMIGVSMQGIDNFAHAGGWITGILLGFAFNPETQPISWIAKRLQSIRLVFRLLAFSFFAILLFSTLMISSCDGCDCER